MSIIMNDGDLIRDVRMLDSVHFYEWRNAQNVCLPVAVTMMCSALEVNVECWV